MHIRPRRLRKNPIIRELVAETRLSKDMFVYPYFVVPGTGVKNAIDAMKGKGNLDLVMEQDGEWIQIKVSDTGIGIPKKQFKTIFEPGFTTKKRGWGLGLSLTKRIVEEYHKGRIKVVQSEIGKGSTIQLSYKKSESI